jgi:hypothetical protein
MLLHLPPAGAPAAPKIKHGPPVTGHHAESVRDAIAAAITTLPEQLRRSLAWDQGAEMARHARLRIDTGLHVYFCDPHSPWQRGTNQNTNGLLRQYFPKGTDLTRPPPRRPRRSRGRAEQPAARDARVAHARRSARRASRRRGLPSTATRQIHARTTGARSLQTTGSHRRSAGSALPVIMSVGEAAGRGERRRSVEANIAVQQVNAPAARDRDQRPVGTELGETCPCSACRAADPLAARRASSRGARQHLVLGRCGGVSALVRTRSDRYAVESAVSGEVGVALGRAAADRVARENWAPRVCECRFRPARRATVRRQIRCAASRVPTGLRAGRPDCDLLLAGKSMW